MPKTLTFFNASPPTSLIVEKDPAVLEEEEEEEEVEINGTSSMRGKKELNKQFNIILNTTVCANCNLAYIRYLLSIPVPLIQIQPGVASTRYITYQNLLTLII